MAESTLTTNLWASCLDHLRDQIPAQKFNTWIRPLQAQATEQTLTLFAPNSFVLDWVKDNFLTKITETLNEICDGTVPDVALEIGSMSGGVQSTAAANTPQTNIARETSKSKLTFGKSDQASQNNINPAFVFSNFVEGKSNQLARAAAQQVAQSPGHAYNPLFLYGGVGLGKTHLMHALGNHILQQNPNAKVLYLHSERFVADMIKALQRNAMNDFKRFYRSVNCLLIDDIQFFARKERSQEEFFHTFNSLLDSHQQIVLTCDKYPKEISGLEERLQSRFGWGLTIAIEPPELETRVAILKSKADQARINLSDDVAFFIAKHIQSNVRELEGALKRVIANAHFTGSPITVDFAREALKDLLTLQAKLVTIENIQRTVAEYYKIKIADILSKRRNRSIARPRQISMALAKELTTHSLPEIGDAFGGRDHTTVLHACRKIKELLATLARRARRLEKPTAYIIGITFYKEIVLMKLNLPREALLNPLQTVIGVVERKQTMQILSNVLIEINGEILSVTGTDSEVELIGRSAVTALEQDQPRITLPGRKLIDICKALPENAAIELYQEKERMILKSGKSRFTLTTLPASEFPNTEAKDENTRFSISEAALRKLLQRTSFAMAQQDVRYYLNGLLFEVNKNTLTTVATDGHRLAANTIDIEGADNHRIQVIIPRKAVLELMRLLTDSDQKVTIMIGNNHIRVESQNYSFTSKLVEGRFPDYGRVIPKGGDKVVSFERPVLRAALQRAAILCNEKFHGVRLELRENLLRILADNPEQEIAEDELLVNYTGNNLDIGFNVNYMLDALNVLETEEVQLKFIDADSSILLEEVNGNQDSTFVIMPMRL